MSDFVAGFAPRHEDAAQLLSAAFAPPSGFAAVDVRERANGQARPRHFSPADPSTNPTAGWDPLDASVEPSMFIDPIEAAHAAGYAEGLAAASVAQAEAATRDKALVADLAAALSSGDRIDRDGLARQLRQTVMFLVTRTIGDVGVAGDLLGARIDAATQLLSDEGEPALLRLNPADVALVEGALPKAVFAAGDASVDRGSFVLESASTVVEDGPALWLEQLEQAIERVAMPPVAC